LTLPVTFINAMNVKASDDTLFVEMWDEGARYVATQPGFIATSLHKSAIHRREIPVPSRFGKAERTSSQPRRPNGGRIIARGSVSVARHLAPLQRRRSATSCMMRKDCFRKSSKV
jgi:hypothetical protein